LSDLGGVFADANDDPTEIGKAGARQDPDITCANDRDKHR
jgi:hypothetical protein